MMRYKPTKLTKMILKTYLKSPTFIFWTILFIQFWIAMAIYVYYGGDINVPREFKLRYIATVYGYLLIVSLGAAGSGTFDLIHKASFSIRFVTKFGRVNERRFLTEHFVAHLMVFLVLCAAFNVLLIGTAYAKFNDIFYPKKPLELIMDLIISSSILYMFSFNLAYLGVLLKGHAARMIAHYSPLLLGFLAYGSLWIDYKYAFYFIPQLVIAGLLYARYSGDKPYTGNILENAPKGTGHADIGLAYLSLVSWIIILFVCGVILLRRTHGARLEEIK